MSQASQAPPTPAASAPNIASALYIKIAWRILPILFVSYIVAYLDRVNVGFAKLTMDSQIGLSETMFGFGAGGLHRAERGRQVRLGGHEADRSGH